MNKSDYPLILQIKDVKEILGVSRSTAYEIAREPDFPLLIINCRKIVYRDDFFKWLDSKRTNPNVISA
ncbi:MULTISPECIES: helix-turn-helix transcriptional regulator [Paenibacillus]|uniref:Excisionase n=1 Tax=Paenibacillus crassostreae TaxID=1763538 RepID=A0A167AGV7_9BACL|nr:MULTISPECIES: helix-turn-helix domain-containing protein [Paenibacillus]AOZ92291.1 DNA-binding protein [Paenibacillus crassostreae]KAA8747240.1 helix-turn-helix domain-containing protein [Paenibacillus sp. UASWS1643]OAB71008.1 excisionase [Paenibacillus crassostreae]